MATETDKLNAVLKREKERQGFYRDLPERLESLDDLKTLPFTTESDLAQKGGRMLLCSQGEIQRIISEQTSGTTGAGKRVFYTVEIFSGQLFGGSGLGFEERVTVVKVEQLTGHIFAIHFCVEIPVAIIVSDCADV